MHKKLLNTAVLCGLMIMFSGVAQAKLSPEEVARLGQDLTPTGAQRAGNASGTIPAWTGGLTQAPAGFRPEAGYADPFADEQPLYTVNAANMAQYADLLSEGHKAMMKQYPSYQMHIYPSHRTLALPAEEYAQIAKEASEVELQPGGAGLVNYEKTSVPFPIPKNGLEAIWNHLVRYRAGGMQRYYSQLIVQSNGSFSAVQTEAKQVMASTLGNPEPNRLYYYHDYVAGPESLAGLQTLVHEPLDQVKETRLAWQYNPGQRRVLRAPEVSYDNPELSADGLRTTDSVDMYNGAPDKYEWKLVGKKEMLISYNNYKLNDRSLKYRQIVGKEHMNQDLVRYEPHRVWVVEATLKEGARHIYAKRRFYLDEDSWNIVQIDHYDGRGELWRVLEAHTLQRYDVNVNFPSSDVGYDLQARRYVVNGVENEEKAPAQFGWRGTLREFSPSALRRAGR
ncbi:DUF1329 domain-containing protein [Zestomonas carbonaria]|uniref:DUF1329 domain-containing protein n=1 Tax=Zestomonas carbonaria TaxID=2762745 RepID=A0A7U7ENT2_9GAMM|nr:DUF1329 domain-containing protein [Pseudomonas carbonaria]CAD5107465.1 hypothetical protein PSEWESI4_01738 [Pseudomonas carbonaria]